MGRVWKPTLDISELYSSPFFIFHRTNVLSEGMRQKIKLILIWQPKQINLKKKKIWLIKLQIFNENLLKLKLEFLRFLLQHLGRILTIMTARQMKIRGGGQSSLYTGEFIKTAGSRENYTIISHECGFKKKRRRHYEGFFFWFHVFLTGFAIQHPGQRPLTKWTKKLICFLFILVQN